MQQSSQLNNVVWRSNALLWRRNSPEGGKSRGLCAGKNGFGSDRSFGSVRFGAISKSSIEIVAK